MNQLEIQYQEILHILDKLLANLGLMLEDYDVEYLTQADLYIEIFKIMFPVLEPVLNADFGEDITDEELIQYLIDVLAKDIIKMDLGHIRGELIAQGDAKNILNFLQLLFEISNMVVDKDDDDKEKRSKKSKNKKLVRSSGNSADQTSNNSEQSSLEMNQKYNSVQGINAEFSNSSVVDSNREASEAGAAEEAAAYYEEVQAGRVQNKMVFDQHQQMKAMKGGDSRGNSRSVSRISEVSKSKESSEYDRGMKKLSQNEFNPAVLQVKGLVASDNGAKRGSYTSDDIRELKGENGEEEEDELEEEQEETENEYEYDQEQQQHQGARQFTNEEEDDGAEEQYYPETNGEDEIEDDDDGFSEQMIKKISKEEVGDDLEYYPNDPINYNPLGKGQPNQARSSHHSAEGGKARAIQSVDVKHNHMEHDEEEEQPEEEYEHDEEQEEEEDELVEEEEQDSQQREYYENEEEYTTPETDPRQMEEVAEEEYEEEYDENAEPNQRMYQAHSGKKVAKGKGKGKAKKSGSKKAVAQPKAVVDYKKPKVEYRPLRPATAGMKRPQTAKPGKTTKVNKSNPVRSSGRKSNESTSSRSKKMLHSKSEKHLNMAEEQEQEQSQYEGQDDYSEDKGMEPKEYQPGDSQVPSQHGHADERSEIEEEEEYEVQDYENQQAQQQIPDGNVFKILSENVMRVKENLRENRAIEDVPYDDEKTVKMIRQQKEQYKQYLKDFVKDHQIREKKYEQMRVLGTKNFQKKMKSETIRDQHMRKDFENQQKSLYFKMRDEKVNYLRRIHKTIFELEKKRIIDEKKEYMQFRKTRNMEAVNMIESIKNQYRHKLSILRENNANQQYERKIASEAQRTFIKTLENELRMDQMKEVERLKDKWRLEKERFDMMIKDEGFLEQKVMQLYKKGVF